METRVKMCIESLTVSFAFQQPVTQHCSWMMSRQKAACSGVEGRPGSPKSESKLWLYTNARGQNLRYSRHTSYKYSPSAMSAPHLWTFVCGLKRVSRRKFWLKVYFHSTSMPRKSMQSSIPWAPDQLKLLNWSINSNIHSANLQGEFIMYGALAAI